MLISPGYVHLNVVKAWRRGWTGPAAGCGAGQRRRVGGAAPLGHDPAQPVRPAMSRRTAACGQPL